MVVFEMKENKNGIVVYEYYPEDNRQYRAGIIELDTVSGRVYIVEPAEDDLRRTVTVEELNAMWDAIDELRRENGGPALTEEELPRAKKPEHSYTYADHAMRKIKAAYEKGEILSRGISIWY